jgi:hypothetical protein
MPAHSAFFTFKTKHALIQLSFEETEKFFYAMQEYLGSADQPLVLEKLDELNELYSRYSRELAVLESQNKTLADMVYKVSCDYEQN